MQNELLLTRFTPPPVRAGVVQRERLYRLLDAGLLPGGRLLLISAPAGSGKTTLAGAWLETLRQRRSAWQAVWVSLAEDSNDPVRFWSYLTGALSADFSSPAELASPDAPPLPVLARVTRLLNQVSNQPERLLVLDDLQWITHPAIAESLAYFIENQPPNLRTLVTTRADPPLPLARWRARGQMVEIRAADLRFTPHETAHFFTDSMLLPLSPEQIGQLEQRTEGWAVGLQLAALSLRGAASLTDFIEHFNGSHQYIVEYLTDEVLRSQPPEIKTFLLTSSLLPRLSAPLCEAVLSAPPGTLQQVEAANLFLTPIDSGRTWFRYHALVNDLLRGLAQSQLAAAERTAIHQRASRWFEAQGWLEEAFGQAQSAADPATAARLLEQLSGPMLQNGEIETFLQRAAVLPPSIRASHLQLEQNYGWALFLNGQSQAAWNILQALYNRIPTATAQRGDVAAMLAVLTSLFSLQDVQPLAEEALRLLPPAQLAGRARAAKTLGISLAYQGDTRKALEIWQQAAGWAAEAQNRFLQASILDPMNQTYQHMGDLQRAEQSSQAILSLARQPNGHLLPFAVIGYHGLADVYLAQGRLSAAESALQQEEDLSNEGGVGYKRFEMHCLLARLFTQRAEYARAQEALAPLENLPAAQSSLFMNVYLSIFEVELALAQNDLAVAACWAEYASARPGMVIEAQSLPVGVREMQQAILARVRLAQNRPAEALALVAGVRSSAQAGGRCGRLVEYDWLDALAYASLGRMPEALAALRTSLTWAQAQGYVQIYTWAGQTGVSLLQMAQQSALPPALRAYTCNLLKALGAEGAPLPPPVALTGRELEILQLLAAGLTNQECCERLVVSMHTIKKHTSNLYAKLGVKSRSQAVARAREWGLV